jgi:hypothetical protein
MLTIPVLRDISLIILIVPTCLCLLVPAAIVFGAWWGVRRTRRALPPVFLKARTGVRRTRDAIDAATQTITRPIYAGETQSARWRAMWRAARSGLQRGR